MRKTHPSTECCGYTADIKNPYPVYWNEFNKVVQCHNCGHVFKPIIIENSKVEVGLTVENKRN
jgi:uncharacterized Zn finger protein